MTQPERDMPPPQGLIADLHYTLRYQGRVARVALKGVNPDEHSANHEKLLAEAACAFKEWLDGEPLNPYLLSFTLERDTKNRDWFVVEQADDAALPNTLLIWEYTLKSRTRFRARYQNVFRVFEVTCPMEPAMIDPFLEMVIQDVFQDCAGAGHIPQSEVKISNIRLADEPCEGPAERDYCQFKAMNADDFIAYHLQHKALRVLG